MATLTLTSDSFGPAMARAGVAMLRRLANVEASVDGVPVVGLLTDAPELAPLGGLAAQAHALQFDCLAADLPDWAVAGTAVSLPAGAYRVVVRTDRTDLGQVSLTLERA